MSKRITFRCPIRIEKKLTAYKVKESLNTTDAVIRLLESGLNGSDEALELAKKAEKKLNFISHIVSKTAFHTFNQSNFMSSEITINAEKEFEEFIEAKRKGVE